MVRIRVDSVVESPTLMRSCPARPRKSTFAGDRFCFRLHSLPARACACSESRNAVQSLRSEVHKKLCEKLASTGSVADMTVEKVRFAAPAAGPRANSFLPALAGS